MPKHKDDRRETTARTEAQIIATAAEKRRGSAPAVGLPDGRAAAYDRATAPGPPAASPQRLITIAILARRVVYGREDDAVLPWPAFNFAPIARMSLYSKTSPRTLGVGICLEPEFHGEREREDGERNGDNEDNSCD